MTPIDFISAHLDAARAVKRTYGVPVAVLLAQAALETGWGGHVVDNAWFGIKGHAPTGEATTFQTTEVLDGKTVHEAQTFRAYTGFQDAAEDYGRFLTGNPRYAACFRYHAADPLGFVQSLAAAGYATDPGYAGKLTAIIRGHSLLQYDTQGSV